MVAKKKLMWNMKLSLQSKSLERKKDKKKLKLNPDAACYVPVKMVNNGEIYGLLMNMIEQQAAPDTESECFGGNPLE